MLFRSGRQETVRWLIDHGAGVNRRSTFGGSNHGEGVTALHLAAQCGDASIVRLLLERGADPRLEDDLYHSTPLGWAEHFARQEVVGLLQEAQR